jgi:hypothetical protein
MERPENEFAAKTEAPSADEYMKIEESIASKRGELASASVDKMSEIVAEIQKLELQKGGAYDAARDEAEVENAERDAQKEEESFAALHDEATAENNRENEAREQERVQELDAGIAAEREKLHGASAEDLSEIVNRIKTLEGQKTGTVEGAGDTSPQAETPNGSETPDAKETGLQMPEAELRSRMEEVFSLNRQIREGGAGWFQNGVLKAHKLEGPIDAEIRSVVGAPEGTDLTAESFKGADELIKISAELDAMPRSEQAYPFYDGQTPDMIKKIQAMDLSFTQKFGALGKLQKTLGASESVKELFKILDAAKGPYEEWSRLNKLRDEKAAEIQPEVTARYGGEHSVKDLIGMPKAWGGEGGTSEENAAEQQENKEDSLSGLTAEDFKEKFAYVDYPAAREAYARGGANEMVDGKTAEEWLSMIDAHVAESDGLRDALYDKVIDGSITQEQKQALADYLIDHYQVANGELRQSTTSMSGGKSSSIYGPRWEELWESPAFAEVVELAKQESLNPGHAPE